MSAPPSEPEKVDETLRNALFAGATVKPKPKSDASAPSSSAPSPTTATAPAVPAAGATAAAPAAKESNTPALFRSASQLGPQLGDQAQRLMKKVGAGLIGGQDDSDSTKLELFSRKEKKAAAAPTAAPALPTRTTTEAAAAAAVAAASAAAAAAAASFFNDGDDLDSLPNVVDVDAALDSVLGDMVINADDNDLDEVEELLKDRLTQFQEDPMVKDALQRGVDLRQYATEIEADLNAVEKLSVEDYIQQGPQLEALNQQIQACDAILETMETMLRGFQGDLGSISDEIQALQNQSLSMNVKIKNRKAMQAELGKFLDEIVISPELVRNIFEAELNESYASHLFALDHKLRYVREQESGRVPAIDAVAPELDKLRLQASERIRDYLLDKIKNLRKPKSNPAIQQKLLLKYKAFFLFLQDNHPATARELIDNYVNIMKDHYFRHFQKYIASTMRLLQAVGDKADVLAVEETVKRGFFGQLGRQISGVGIGGGGVASSASGHVVGKDGKSVLLSLGERGNVLGNIDNADVLLPHVAEENNQKMPFETLYRSQARMLMDNASSEFLFVIEFFSVRGDAAQEVFLAIFDTSIALSLQTLRTYLEDCYDAIGILLCIRINMEHQRILMQRRVPCLDQYVNQVNLALWPRYQRILDRHILSVRTLSPTTWGALTPSSPHPLCRRYGDFVSSILTLIENQSLDPAASSLGRLHFEMESVLLRMAAEFADRQRYLAFLINGYDAIVGALGVGQGGQAEAENGEGERATWSRLLALRTAEYVEEELAAHVDGLVMFVKAGEAQKDITAIEVGRFELISSEFSTSWKVIIGKMSNSVSAAFSNQQLGASILQLILKQLLVDYSRFLLLVEKRFGRNTRPPFRQDVIGLEQLRFEIRKLRPGM